MSVLTLTRRRGGDPRHLLDPGLHVVCVNLLGCRLGSVGGPASSLTSLMAPLAVITYTPSPPQTVTHAEKVGREDTSFHLVEQKQSKTKSKIKTAIFIR